MDTTARLIPMSIAALLEELELDQPRLVTTDDVADLRRRTGGTASTDYLVAQLLKNGWLLPLTTRGVWEFAPAARAGAFSSGDRFIELRATLRKRPTLPVAVAAESAAWLLGLAGRVPARDVISAPDGLVVPVAVRAFRLVRRPPRLDPIERDGLPCWSILSLLAIMADRPTTYRDWPNVSEWLADACADLSFEPLADELVDRPRSAWARLGYLVATGGRDDIADTLMTLAPAGKGPYFLGRRDRTGHHDRRFDVIDSALTQGSK